MRMSPSEDESFEDDPSKMSPSDDESEDYFLPLN